MSEAPAGNCRGFGDEDDIRRDGCCRGSSAAGISVYIDTTQEDHIYDECRYVLMENPISGAKHTTPPPMLDDPLDMDPRKDKTRFMRI